MTCLTRLTLAVTVSLAALGLEVGPAAAQATQDAQTDKYLELMRQDIRTQKTAIVTEAMDLTDAQSQVFWPIYDAYSAEMRQVWDGRIANIKDFAENYQRMTSDKAKQLADRSFKLREQYLKVLKKYHGKLAKELDPMLAARFVQVEAAIDDLLSLQVAAELPLMK